MKRDEPRRCSSAGTARLRGVERLHAWLSDVCVCMLIAVVYCVYVFYGFLVLLSVLPSSLTSAADPPDRANGMRAAWLDLSCLRATPGRLRIVSFALRAIQVAVNVLCLAVHEESGFRRVSLKQILNLKGWHSQAHGELPQKSRVGDP